MPKDHDAVPATSEPAAALLPGLDPTAMGWRHRDWYLDPDHSKALFDRNGNIGPTIWWNGRDEWQVFDRRYLSEGSMAELFTDTPGPQQRQIPAQPVPSSSGSANPSAA